MAGLIDSDALAARYRARILRRETKEILITRLAGSEQEADLSAAPNCEGLGRLRHFRRTTQSGAWGDNPLPIDPAQEALALTPSDVLVAQAFQNAACNWRCWYCFVPFNLLAADETRSAWVTAQGLVSMFADLPDRPSVIDLTGGQPDLVPEWVPWTMSALEDQGLESQVYLWSDDNLSNDYFWRYLSKREIEQVARWPRYGRVCCFKGFNRESFAFNTAADEELFDRQFELFSRLLTLGLDLYAYVTLTTPTLNGVRDDVARFVDRLQEIDANLPLRTVPLRIETFSPVQRRLKSPHVAALRNQDHVVEAFRNEIDARFPIGLRGQIICDIPLGGRPRDANR